MNNSLIEVKNLTKVFQSGSQTIRALSDVNLSVDEGKVLGIGGESGCGKSTLAKLIMGLILPSSGMIFFEGMDLQELIRERGHLWRKDIQMIFQQPSSSLNPRMNVETILKEPFVIHRHVEQNLWLDRIVELLELVGLSSHHLKRMPQELSGGQKQRIAIARALAVRPRLLICDEPFSALDVSVQAQIIDLLMQLKRDQKLTYLVISHDLAALHYMCDDIAIMHEGKIVEYGPSEQLFQTPTHPYTKALLSAVLNITNTVNK